MAVHPFATGQSKVAGGILVLAAVILPVVNIDIHDKNLQLNAFYIISVCIGCALGWVVGDALAHSTGIGKAITGIVAAIGLISPFIEPIRKYWDKGSFLYNTFIGPIEGGLFSGAIQWGGLSFVLLAIFSFFYCLAGIKKAQAA
jgi:hypothetical protein